MRYAIDAFADAAGWVQGEAPDADVPEIHRVGEEWHPGNQTIPMHRHDDWELYLQVDGTSCWEGSGRTFTLTPGCLYLAPSGVEHALVGKQRHRHHYIFAGFDRDALMRRLPEIASAWSTTEMIIRTDAASLLPPFRLLVREVALRQATGRRACARRSTPP